MISTTSLPGGEARRGQPAAEARTPYTVIIAHDDYPAYVRAMRMLANTFFGHPAAADLRPQPWRFDDLGREVWRKRAVTHAAEADVFVVSTSATGDLPESVKLWLNDCLALRRELPTAVIALCDSLNDLEVPWRRLLREAATAAGVDFLEASAPKPAAAN